MQFAHSKLAKSKPGLFSHESAIEHWLSGTDVRKDAEKSQREAQSNFDICLYLHKAKWPEGRIIVRVWGGEGRELCQTKLVIGSLSAMWA